MKKFLHILGLAALLSSCEIPFDLEEGGEPKIYMQCVAQQGCVYVTPQVAQPVSGKAVDVSSLEVEVWLDGEVIPALRRDGYYVADFGSRPEEGARVSVAVHGGGLETARGETRLVPAPNVVDYSWTQVQVDTIDATQVSITLDHAPAEGEYYGIQILQADTIEYMDGSKQYYVAYLTPGYILTAAESVGFDLADFVQVNFDGFRLGGADYQPLTLLSDKHFDGATYRFYLNSFDTSILSGIRDNLPDSDTGIAGGGIVSGQVGGEGGGGEVDPSKIPVRIETCYCFILYRLSPEFYFYARALYQSNFDFLANMGLVPANFTWSNVTGGLGFVGAAASTNLYLDKEEEF